MRDWQIALMVIMCVVFVVGVTVLCFLIWRVSRWYRGDKSKPHEASAWRHERRRYDSEETSDNSSGNVVMNEQHVTAAHAGALTPTTMCATGVAAVASAAVGASVAEAHVLYFVDGGGVVRGVDFHALPHICTGAALQQHIAAVCHLDDADTLALVYYADDDGTSVAPAANTAATTTTVTTTTAPRREVWVDLDALVTRDAAFAQRLWQTSRRPLVLSRLTPVVRDAVAPPRLAEHNNNNNNNNNSSDRRQHRDAFDVSLSLHRDAPTSRHDRHSYNDDDDDDDEHRRARHDRGVSSHARRAGHVDAHHAALLPPPPPLPSSTLPSSIASSSSSMVALVPPPLPVILPTRTHITTATHVRVTAAHYYTTQAMHGLTEDGYRLDAQTCVALETAMYSNNDDNNNNNTTTTSSANAASSPATTAVQRVHITRGRLRNCYFVVEAARQSVWLHVPGLAAAIPVVRRGADVLRVAVDATSASQWSLVAQPFCLPAGRWCVRAKASTFDDVHYTTSAKVYTVDVTT